MESRTIFYCQNCRERRVNSILVDCDCFHLFEAECSRQCLNMDQGFFKIWLTDTYGSQPNLLMNFAFVRCQHIISYFQQDESN